MPMRHVGEAARRVESRARDESEVVRGRAARVAARDREQRVHARVRLAARDMRARPCSTKHAVGLVQADDVGDGAERHEVEQRREIRLAAAPRTRLPRAIFARVANST